MGKGRTKSFLRDFLGRWFHRREELWHVEFIHAGAYRGSTDGSKIRIKQYILHAIAELLSITAPMSTGTKVGYWSRHIKNKAFGIDFHQKMCK